MRHLHWLYEELPKWVSEGLITEEAADRLRLRYGEAPLQERHWGRLVWMGLAALFIAFGALLLVSEQWFDITRDTRFSLVIGIAVIAQLAVAWVLYRQPQNVIWREAVGVFYGLAWPGTLYLMSSMYTLNPFMEWKLVLWGAILLLPGVYLLRSVCLASMYALFAASFAWAQGNQNAWFGENCVWLLLLAAVPYFYVLWRDGWKEKALLLFGWCYGIAVYVAYFLTLGSMQAVALGFYAILAAFTFLVGTTILKDRLHGLPFRIIGSLGMVTAMITATLRSEWVSIGKASPSILAVVILVLLLAALAGVAYRLYLRRMVTVLLAAVFPFLVALSTLVASFEVGYTAISIIMMLYYAVVTTCVLVHGLRHSSLLYTDVGLVMVGVFVIARLMDGYFSYIERGIAFLVIGIIILAFHWWTLRKQEHRKRRQRMEMRRAQRRVAEMNPVPESEEPVTPPARKRMPEPFTRTHSEEWRPPLPQEPPTFGRKGDDKHE